MGRGNSAHFRFMFASVFAPLSISSVFHSDY
jgi:hypothetical protein